MTLYKWSQTATSNDVIDSTINWAENQAPSTINNSARAVMAAVAKFRDDLSGSITTGGTSTAYTVTSNQVITANTDKFYVGFVPHVTCGATVTLSVDGQTARPLRPYHNTEFLGGELQIGGAYSAVYSVANAEWIVDSYFGNMMTTGAGGNFATTYPDLVSAHAQGAGGTLGVLRKTAANTYALDQGTTAIMFEKDGNTNVLATGIMGDAYCPFAATITGVTLVADQSGSAVVDIWKAAYSSYPPTVANTITAAALPTLSSATKYQDLTLTGWTTAISAGDMLRFNLNSVTTCTRLTLAIRVNRFI
jgi:hypothetical protein